ncbi:MAG: peptidoglycan-binding protein [Azospirillaceae bacterium]
MPWSARRTTGAPPRFGTTDAVDWIGRSLACPLAVGHRWGGLLAILLALISLGNPPEAFAGFELPDQEGGVAYLIFDGTEDPAIRALGRRALDGDIEAMGELADRYVAGDGVPRDLAAAQTWYAALARHGDARAAFNVAALLEREDDPGSPARAAVAYAVALAGGIDEAADRITVLAGSTGNALGEDDLRQLQERLALLGFDPGPADGLVGPRTREALAAWLNAAALPDDLPVGPVALALLRAWRPDDPQ